VKSPNAFGNNETSNNLYRQINLRLSLALGPFVTPVVAHGGLNAAVARRACGPAGQNPFTVFLVWSG
jgi:hypothetical protein